MKTIENFEIITSPNNLFVVKLDIMMLSVVILIMLLILYVTKYKVCNNKTHL